MACAVPGASSCGREQEARKQEARAAQVGVGDGVREESGRAFRGLSGVQGLVSLLFAAKHAQTEHGSMCSDFATLQREERAVGRARKPTRSDDRAGSHRLR